MGRGKKIGMIGLVMINLIAIDSLRNIPITAPAGLKIVLFYLIGTLCFFLPCALATAELSTRWPKNGGISCWIEEAFGKTTSFFVVWMQWIYNLIWFPSITAFAATQLAYAIGSVSGADSLGLSNNAIYVTVVSLATFWIATILNFRSMRTVERVSTFGALFGTLGPMLLITLLGVIWWVSGHHMHIIYKDSDITGWNSLGLTIVVLFSLMGVEMASSHAGSVRKPLRDFPKALWITVLLIPISLVLANLAIGIVVPSTEIDNRAGLMQSFEVFFQAFHIPWMDTIMALCLFVGAFTGIAAWAFGLSRYLKTISDNGFMPKILGELNKANIPQNAMIFQGFIVSAICLIYLWMPNIQSAYWFLSDLTAQLALIAYIIFFMSAIRLRLTRKWKPEKTYSLKNRFVSVTIYAIGIITCFAGMGMGFVLPSSSSSISIKTFDAMLISGIFVSLLIPATVILFKKNSIYNTNKK